jgi:hypothetical protein
MQSKQISLFEALIYKNEKITKYFFLVFKKKLRDAK